MAIEKGLYAAPQGIDELMMEQDTPELEIEIEDPEAVHIGIDGQPILDIEQDDEEDTFDENLAEDMDESDLQSLGEDQIGRAHV